VGKELCKSTGNVTKELKHPKRLALSSESKIQKESGDKQGQLQVLTKRSKQHRSKNDDYVRMAKDCWRLNKE
jgi:hypothetical protein